MQGKQEKCGYNDFSHARYDSTVPDRFPALDRHLPKLENAHPSAQ